MDLLHALNVTVHLHVLACTTIVIILFTNLGSESAFGELQVRLSLALITLGRRVSLGLSSVAQTFFLSITLSKLRRGQSNSIISQELGFARHSVHDVAFLASGEIAHINSLVKLLLNTAVLLQKLNLALSNDHSQDFRLLGTLLADREIEDQVIIVDRLHSRRVDIHLIPRRLDYTIPQQL